MQNLILTDRTAGSIDRQVAKLLKDVGDPEPPLRLEIVHDLLNLDRGYYSSSTESILKDIRHYIKIAGKQISSRPSLLLEAAKKLDLKALYLPDQKRILIDSELPKTKQRWGDAHEIIHSVLEWHADLMFGDTAHTLTQACHDKMEAEANYGAGRLLFLGERFTNMITASPLNLTNIRGLAKKYGNSITSTMWRAVENSGDPVVALVSCHPHYPGENIDPKPPCRYFIRSKKFAQQFPNIKEAQIFALVKQYCRASSRGPLGETDAIATDCIGDKHIFMFETFYNGYEALTLGSYSRPKLKSFPVSSARSHQ